MSKEYYRLRCKDEATQDVVQEPVEVSEPVKPKTYRRKKGAPALPLTPEERLAKSQAVHDARIANEKHYNEQRLYIVGLTKSLIEDGHTGEGFNRFGSNRWNCLDRRGSSIAHARWNDEFNSFSQFDKCNALLGLELPSDAAKQRIAQRKAEEGSAYDVHKYPNITDYLLYGNHTYFWDELNIHEALCIQS